MFWFRLAAKLGLSVREAQARISSPEFAEWLAFNRLDPIGEERADARAALIALAVTRAAWSGKGRAPRFEDFMPDYAARAAAASPTRDAAAAMEQNFTLWARRHNRRIERDKEREK